MLSVDESIEAKDTGNCGCGMRHRCLCQRQRRKEVKGKKGGKEIQRLGMQLEELRFGHRSDGGMKMAFLTGVEERRGTVGEKSRAI